MRVLISGAGIAGNTLAFLLSKAGAKSITVIDNATKFLFHGHIMDINSGAVTVLEKMNLLDDLKAVHMRERGTRLITKGGKAFATRQNDDKERERHFKVNRGDLASMLHRKARDLHNVDFHFNTSIKRIINNDAEQPVQIELESGKEEEYDLIVGADGQWSNTRSLAFDPQSVKEVDKRMQVAYVTMPGEAIDGGYRNVFMALKGRVITTRPGQGGRTHATLSIYPTKGEKEELWKAAWKAGQESLVEMFKYEFKDAGWQAQTILERLESSPEDAYIQILKEIKMEKWSNNRVVCLGDAAWHCTPLIPTYGNTAISGAYILAGEIEKMIASKLSQTAFLEEAFNAYEKLIRPCTDRADPRLFRLSMYHPTYTAHRHTLQILYTLNSIMILLHNQHHLTAVTNAMGNAFFERLLKLFQDPNCVDGLKLPIYKSLDEKLNRIEAIHL